MRPFHHLLWLSCLGFLNFECSPSVILSTSDDAGRESGTGTDSGPGTDSGATGTCSSNADCAANERCGFPESPACTAIGQCFPSPEPTCAAYSPGCACNGTEINIACTGFPTGYASEPLLHTGACADGGPSTDGGGSDGGPSSCVTNQDCGGGRVCGYPLSAACSAQGECFEAMVGVFSCPNDPGACACDGVTTVATGCAGGLPTGYASRPVEHVGFCSDSGPSSDGGGSDATSGACLTDTDCPANERCGIPDFTMTSSACGVQRGTCFPASEAELCGASAVTHVPQCACGDGYISVDCNGLPAGYVGTPLISDGTCAQCLTDNDCATGQVCGFPESASCGTRGYCFAPLPSVPNVPCAAEIACGCDGTMVPTGCAANLPYGYARKPAIQAGPCADASSSADASPPPDASRIDASSTCTVDADCGTGMVCGFPESVACSATGQCFPAPGATCTAWLPGCACDGTEINTTCTGLPTGYVTKPLHNAGPCTDDGGVICTSSFDCAADEVCGFPENAGCGYAGRCFPAVGSTCMAFSPGCACDGTDINLVCNGLPAGYETQPLLHAGACADGG